MEIAMEAIPSTKAPTELQCSIIATKHQHPELTTREIAKLNDTVHSHVIRTLHEYGIDTDRVERYKSARADILAGIQERVIRTKFGTDDDVKSMPDAAAILLFNSCFNNERLERGQATEISVNFDAVKAIDARRKEIEARIRAIESGNDDKPQDVVLEAEISTPIMLEDATNTVQHTDMTGDTTDSAKLTYDTLSDVGPRQGKRRGRPRKGR